MSAVLGHRGEGEGGAPPGTPKAPATRPIGDPGRRLPALRAPLFAVGHLALFVICFRCAFELRFDFSVPDNWAAIFWEALVWVVAVKLLVFLAGGLLHGLWYYVTFADLLALVRAALISLALIAGIDYFFIARYQIPRAVVLLDAMLTVVLVGSLRASWRLLIERFHARPRRNGHRWALVIGTDHASAMLAIQIQSSFDLPVRIRGFLTADGDQARKGIRLGQIPILGNLDQLAEIAAAHGAQDVLVTPGTLGGERLRRLIEDCREARLTLKIIPTAENRLEGDHRIPLRDIDIGDLLRREPVVLDTAEIEAFLAGRKVLVAGAGGSIGAELCRQVLRFRPAALVLLGRGENRIFAIERELRQSHPQAELIACIGDVADAGRMRAVFARCRPQVVFHAAAHKHVPLMEDNASAAVKNNVLGTQCIADRADECGVERFVLISTDKAVHPASVMGVSKYLAERYVEALAQRSATRFTAVRFGNVLGAAGSVVPIFQEQIRSGGPITVTDPRMARYFMTIPESAQLVLQAAALGRGGEVFVLDMGAPVRIVDLARDLIRLSGLPDHAVEIAYSGIRPGEKLFEELCCDDEHTLPTAHPRVRQVRQRPLGLDAVRASFEQLAALLDGPEEALRQRLHELVPDFPAVPWGERTAMPAAEGLLATPSG